MTTIFVAKLQLNYQGRNTKNLKKIRLTQKSILDIQKM